jgi:hypothetical protein
MNNLRSRAILAGAMAALLLPASGAAARNIKAKPEPGVCAAARAQGQILPGCPQPERNDQGAVSAPSAPAPTAAAPGERETPRTAARDQ